MELRAKDMFQSLNAESVDSFYDYSNYFAEEQAKGMCLPLSEVFFFRKFFCLLI